MELWVRRFLWPYGSGWSFYIAIDGYDDRNNSVARCACDVWEIGSFDLFAENMYSLIESKVSFNHQSLVTEIHFSSCVLEKNTVQYILIYTPSIIIYTALCSFNIRIFISFLTYCYKSWNIFEILKRLFISLFIRAKY